MRTKVASLLGVIVIAASCGGPVVPTLTPRSVPPSPAEAPLPTPGQTTIASDAPAGTTAPSTEVPVATPAPTPILPVTGGRWKAAGKLAIGRRITHALVLGDGRVLVVGNDADSGCVRADSRRTELFDPATGRWRAGPRLNKGRAAFGAVALDDGRALVTGGINPDEASYSSTYLLSPDRLRAGWARSGLLDAARTMPACARLADGRVLVAGGFYQDGPPPVEETPPGETGAIPYTPALASAELYDPATGRWSNTGRLRMARNGAAAVGLADGRALVVGSNDDSGFASYVDGPVDAFASAELFDPGTGRFTMTGDLPPIDWAPVLGLEGATDPEAGEGVEPSMLVALPGGDALLFGRAFDWWAGRGWQGITVRTLRFHADDGTWTTVDETTVACDGLAVRPSDCDEAYPWTTVVDGHARTDAAVITLADGKVLVAGGVDPRTNKVSRKADLYDPEADTWITLPRLPKPRAGSAAALLHDGSVLLVGGYATTEWRRYDCGARTTGLAPAIRFVPSR